MPAKRRKITPRPTSFNAPHVSPQGASNYRHFLNTYIAGPGSGTSKPYLSSSKVGNWSDAPTTDQGNIINEIADKFNRTNSLGIHNVSKYGTGGEDNLYGADARGPIIKTNMTLAPPENENKSYMYGPNPHVIGHELVHANDHQSINPIPPDSTDRFPNLNRDRLNPRIWANLSDLAQTGGSSGKEMANLNEFQSSISRIQNKLAPNIFGPTPGDNKSGYPFSRDYIERDIEKSRQMPEGSYQTPMMPNGTTPNWPELFKDIQAVVNPSNVAPDNLPNPGFFLSRASEFPAFMSENLTRPWDTSDRANNGANPLTLPEARFLHSSLGNMGNSYLLNHGTENHSPVTNHYTMERRNSIENAYPALRAQQPVSSSSQSSSSSSNPIPTAIGGGQSSLPSSSQFSSITSPHTPPSSPNTPVFYSPVSLPNPPSTYKRGGTVHSLAERVYPFKLRQYKSFL